MTKYNFLYGCLKIVRQARSIFSVCLFSILYPKLGIGCKVTIAQFVRLRVTDGAVCDIANEVVLDRSVDITVKYGKLNIGERSYIGQGAMIVVRDEITIGNDCLIAEYVSIRDQDHAIKPHTITANNGFVTAPIHIGNNVWIGTKVTITKGVTIGDNVVIGAGAVVTSDIPDNVVAVGVPAKVMRKIGNNL